MAETGRLEGASNAELIRASRPSSPAFRVLYDRHAWDCYVGRTAADHEIITEDLLGEPVLGPGRG